MTDRTHSLGWRIGVGLARGLDRTFGSLFEKTAIASLGAFAGLRGWKLFKDTLALMPEEERIAIARRFTSDLPETMTRIFMPRVSDHKCEDCERFGHGYMLTDEIWAEASAKDDVRLLCLPCVEVRLGRPLVPGDFISPELAPINGPLVFAMTIVMRSLASTAIAQDASPAPDHPL